MKAFAGLMIYHSSFIALIGLRIHNYIHSILKSFFILYRNVSESDRFLPTLFDRIKDIMLPELMLGEVYLTTLPCQQLVNNYSKNSI